MAFIASRDPGRFFSNADQRAKGVNQALAQGKRPLDASNTGGVVALSQVRGVRGISSASTSQPRLLASRISSLGSDVGMHVPRFPSVPVCGRSAPDGPPDMWPSQNNNFYLKNNIMPYGRQLRGFGMLPDSPAYGDTWSGNDPDLADAAQADDVAGNGIFDGAGAPPTAHAGSGVFESRFSLPGYLYREQPTEPSEVRDTTTGMPVVYQPDAGAVGTTTLGIRTARSTWRRRGFTRISH